MFNLKPVFPPSCARAHSFQRLRTDTLRCINA